MVPRYSGSKLKTLKAQRTLHEGEIAIAKQRRDAAEQAVKNEGRIGDGDHEIKFAAGKKLREALADTALYLKIKNILAVVEQMVKDETKVGWNWKTGHRAQPDERNVLYELVAELSEEADRTFIPVAQVINTY